MEGELSPSCHMPPPYTRSMVLRSLVMAALFVTSAVAQTVCPTTPAYSACDIVFELDEKEMAAHPNPYLTVNIKAEIRSPRARTVAPMAFWDGGNRMVVRFAPTSEGQWDFKITSNIERFHNK